MPSPRSIRWPILVALSLLVGCMSFRKHDELPPPPPDQPINANEVYTLACPDMLEVIFLDWPDVSQTVKIGADGCIVLGNLGKLRVEGETSAEAGQQIGDRAEIPARKVRVQVVEYNSRQLLVYGEVNGEPRVVDYRGPETVVELLLRVGGLAHDAAPNEIHVVRAHVGEGIPAEVLPVDLEAILEKYDERTNIRVQPLDAIYVGEMTRYRIAKAVPTFLKPAYAFLVEFIPTRKASAARDHMQAEP